MSYELIEIESVHYSHGLETIYFCLKNSDVVWQDSVDGYWKSKANTGIIYATVTDVMENIVGFIHHYEGGLV